MTDIITVEQVVHYTLPVQAVEDIIEGAGDYIGYWAYEADMDTVNQTYTITEQDEPTNTVHKVTYKDIVDACAKIVSGKASSRSDIMSAVAQAFIDYENADMDADCYDVIIQVACFGEIIYG